jgi:lysophospholipase L1-like esterase
MRIPSFVIVACITGAACAEEYALRNGDTVVFLGDSITAARTYGKIIENYTLLRFPDRSIRFYNAGWGGDTMAGGLARFERDVLIHKPTVVVVAYGFNDIGWGTKANEASKKTYLDALAGILEQCATQKARVYICSAATQADDPEKSEHSFLQKMCDEGMDLARAKGQHAIDVQRVMRGIQKKVVAYSKAAKESDSKKTSLHAADGVHLNDLGQLVMAYAILKGLDAPAEVSSARLDAATGKALDSSRCKITDINSAKDRFEFTRLDDGLPFNYGLFYALHYRFVPVPDELNRYMLRVEGLAEGRWQLTVDERGVGAYTHAQLARGVNLSFATSSPWQPGGPWDAQAHVLRSLTEARHDLATASTLSRAYLPKSELPVELAGDVRRADEQLIALQRRAAQPRPYRFVLTKKATP